MEPLYRHPMQWIALAVMNIALCGIEATASNFS